MEDKTPEEISADKRQASLEQAEKRAAELSSSLNCKVHPIVLGTEGEFVGFIKEPKLQAKKAAFDKIFNDQVADAGEIILTSSLIKEESAAEFEIGKNDDVYLSACIAAFKILKVYANAYKKK